ncbi:MAG: RNA polymerase sigma factor [Planctomycetota bacterium]
MTIPADPTVDEQLRQMDWLRRLARSLVLDGAEAEDVAQETWLRAASVGAGATELRSPWLAGVLRNVVRARDRSDARRRFREREVARAEARPSVLDDAVVLERQRALLKRVSALPTEQRRAVLARYYDGRTPREIAALEGIPVATVKSRIKRGLATLREDLDRDHGDRRAWATAIAPLAAPVGKGAGLMKLAALGTLAVAATIGVAASLGGAPVVETPATLTVTPPIRSQDDDGTRAIELHLVDTNGRPAPGVEGKKLDETDFWRILEAGDASDYRERNLFSPGFGSAVRSDGDGIVRFTAQGRFRVLFKTDSAIAKLESDENLLATRLPLRPARPVLVTVDGEDPATSVVATLHRARGYGNLAVGASPPRLGRGSDALSSEVRREVIDGTAVFQTTLSAVMGSGWDDRSAALFLTDFHANVPGLAQYESDYVVQETHRLHVPGPEAVRVTVPMPPTGRLELRVTDGDQSLAANGTASLRLGSSRRRGATVPIVDGVATWPHVVVGSRGCEVEVELTGPCARYVIDGSGPENAGDTVTLDAPMPTKRRLSMRLLHGGRALRRQVVEFQGPRDSGALPLRGRTDDDGRLRVWLGPREGWTSGTILAGWPGRTSDAGDPQAWFGPWSVDENSVPDVDLGDIELDLAPPWPNQQDR